MKNISLTFLLLFSCSIAAQEHYMIVGTYDSPKSDGIYVFRFNSTDGTAREIGHAPSSNPSFLTISPNGKFIYAVFETAPQDGKGGDIAAYAFDQQTGGLRLINQQRSGGDHPCHVELDQTGKWLFASNYSSGTLSVLPVNPDGSLGNANTIQHSGSGQHPQRQKGPHAHGATITKDNRYLLVTDLGIDKVMIYSFDATTGILETAAQPFARSVPGSGPRQICFHPNNKYAYLVEELSGTVVFFKYKKGRLIQKQRISTLAAGDTLPANSADVHVSRDGKFLYASNRGEVNSIAIYRTRPNGRLTLVGHQPTLGRTPRHFSMDPSGNYLLCANQNSDEIVIFKRDVNSGLLTDTGNRVKLGKPVCIKWTGIQ